MASTSTTGDLNGAGARLGRELRQLKYTNAVDEVGLRIGDPAAILPLLHFVLLRFSRHVAHTIAASGYELQGKTDQRFVEHSFKLFRDCLGVRTVLTTCQFLDQGFAERKILLLCDVITACKKIHNDEIRKERLLALKSRVGTPSHIARLHEPSRKTPEITIIKGGGQEIRHVMSPVHLPNATGGGQSVYAVKQLQRVTPSPSPSRGAKGPLANPAHTHSSSPTASAAAHSPLRPLTAGQAWLQSPWAPQQQQQREPEPPMQGQEPSMTSTWLQSWLQDQPKKGGQQQQQQQWAPGGDYPVGGVSHALGAGPSLGEEDAEVTFRPSSVLAAALATPVHSWFANPAFGANNNSGGVSRAARSSEGVVAAAWGGGAEEGGDAWRPHGSHGREAQPGAEALRTGGSLRRQVGGEPAAGVSTASAYVERGAWVAGSQAHPAGSPGSSSAQASQQEQWASAGSRSAQASQQQQQRQVPPAPVPAHSSGVPVPALQQQQQQWGVPQGQDQPEAGRPAGVSGRLDSHSTYSTGPDSHSVHSSYPSSPPAAGRQQQDPYSMREQRQQYEGSTIPVQAGSGSMPIAFTAPETAPIPLLPPPGAGLHSGGPPMHEQQLLWALERRLEGRVEELGQRVESAEAGLQGSRHEAAESREALAARMTVMEGRVRFLECEVDACVRRGEYRPEQQQQQQRGEAGVGGRSPGGEAGRGSPGGGEGGGARAWSPEQMRPGSAAASAPRPTVHWVSGDRPPTAWAESDDRPPIATFSPPRGFSSSAPYYSALRQPVEHGVGGSDRPPAALRSSAAYSAQRQSQSQAEGPKAGERRHALWWQQQRDGERQGGPQAVRNLSAPTPSFGFQPAALMQRLSMGSPGSSPGTSGRGEGDGGLAGQQQWASRSGVDAGGRPVWVAEPTAAAGHDEIRWTVRSPVTADSPPWEAPRGPPLTAPRTQVPSRQPATFSSGPPAAAAGSGPGPPGAGGTSELIESLVRRYTEAQSFLAHVRQSQ